MIRFSSLSPYLFTFTALILLQGCSTTEADTPAQDPADVEAAASTPKEPAEPQPVEIENEPIGQPIAGLPYIAYRAIETADGKLAYCADYDDQKQPMNAVVIQPENTWSGNLIFYEDGKMNVMAYKDMRSPDKERFFFKDLGKSWKYGGKKVSVSITLEESYGDVLTVTVNQLGTNDELDKIQYIHSEKLANYQRGKCPVFAKEEEKS
ncbi:MAG: hypothetical protein ACOCZ8_02195 [Bacteroidota bacterium]